MPNANLPSYQEGFHYAEAKLLIAVSLNIKSLSHDIKVFKPALKDNLSSQILPTL
jgi:hypothetical protein